MKTITKYFRDALLASLQPTIDYKNDKYDTITAAEIENGRIENLKSLKILSGVELKADEEKELIIALKTFKTKYLSGQAIENNIEEMTSVFFMPVKMNFKGELAPPDDKYPWIPREYLDPMVEPQIAVGKEKDYDIFLENSIDKKNQIELWNDYLEYSKEMYEAVTHSKLSDIFIGENRIETDGKFYIFFDEIVNATVHLKQVYNDLLEYDDKNLKLYSKMTDGNIEASRLINTTDKMDFNKMKYHSGQMGGEYPLSSSQREAISCFSEIKNGEVLAVNGPPGTGKTTLLQSIVANMYVNAALKKDKAPVIVATSTNNQAVTNIIDSFGSINEIGIKNLEKRWIASAKSFAVYFPAASKMNDEKLKKYQWTDVYGNGFIESIEEKESREKDKQTFLNCFKEYFIQFKNKDITIDSAKEFIHQNLLYIDHHRRECINKFSEIAKKIQKKDFQETKNPSVTVKKYLSDLEETITLLNEKMEVFKEKESEYQIKEKHLKERMDEWRNSYDKLLWYVRLFKFIPYIKKKIDVWSFKTMQEEELEFLDRGMDIDQIEEMYCQQLSKNDDYLKEIKEKYLSLEQRKETIHKEYQEIVNLVNEIKALIESFHIDGFHGNLLKFDMNQSIKQWNDSLDVIRYIEFWMSVHYYEAVWLTEERGLSDNQKKSTFEKVLDIKYRRLAMIAPCMVMTCYMLPKQFKAYVGNEKKDHYMYNYADLLIVDEAGQISPEIGMPAFAFAKKAIVVGDEYQIPPVWGTTRALNIAMAIENEVIKSKEDYEKLEENGLNCSQSSIIKIASLSCKFEKEHCKGLFLSEHRRCYNEIIQYCNDLVYKGKLEPFRGTAESDKKYKLKDWLPPMGYKQIDSAHSEKAGTSRTNKREAEEIVAWVNANYNRLVQCYTELKPVDDKTLLGIITPFKAQSMMIKRKLKKANPKLARKISVGTVHTFQGAERKVIIFSSVYGKDDNCYFINANKSLMNVAVSRAKDSFLVFGDRDCLKGGKGSAAVMLKHAVNCQI